MPNKLLSPEKYAHYVMLLFFPLRNEKQLLSGSPPLYQNKLQKQVVQDVVNRNRIQNTGIQEQNTGTEQFQPYDVLVDQFFPDIDGNPINNQDPHSQIDNDETVEAK